MGMPVFSSTVVSALSPGALTSTGPHSALEPGGEGGGVAGASCHPALVLLLEGPKGAELLRVLRQDLPHSFPPRADTEEAGVRGGAGHETEAGHKELEVRGHLEGMAPNSHSLKDGVDVVGGLWNARHLEYVPCHAAHFISYSAVQCSAVQCSAVQCSTVKCRIVKSCIAE